MKNNKLIEEKLNDFELLKNIINDEVKIENIDNEVKQRIIELCNSRLKGLNKEIAKKEEKIDKLKQILVLLGKYKEN